MSAQAARSYMSIGEVLSQLRPSFPDVTISKIRFLESEGLIEPQRSPSGYRRFAHADVERLAFILAAQRDHYLPLRVIKEHLAALDSGAEPPHLPGTRLPRALVAAPTDGQRSADVQLTQPELLAAAEIDAELLSELEDYGLLSRTGRHYDAEALTIARTAGALHGFGLQARHLRAVKGAADREIGLVEQAVAPILRQRNPGARERAEATAREITGLMVTLHTALVRAGLGATLAR